MSAIKRVLFIGIVALAVLSVAGCLGQSDRDKAQDAYNQKVIGANDQIAVVENISAMQNIYAMDEPLMKAWLTKYRAIVVVLETNVSTAINASDTLKRYLSPGTSDYATVTTNDQNLLLNLDLYRRDYNKNAESYNSHWGPQNGTVPLL
jgi:hypothetical protein